MADWANSKIFWSFWQCMSALFNFNNKCHQIHARGLSLVIKGPPPPKKKKNLLK